MRIERGEGVFRAQSLVAVVLLTIGCATTAGEGDSRNGATTRDASSPGPDVIATGGAAGGPASGGSGGGAGAFPYPVGKCPEGLPGPALVNVPAPNGRTYCIDATEVTRGQYRQFVEARYTKPFVQVPPKCDGGIVEGTSQQACEDVVLPSCDGNVYEPTERLTDPADGADLGCTWWLDGKDDYPINCIDWCDAAGYCEWAGKRLCGRVGAINELIGACEGWWDGAPWSQGTYSAPGFNELTACNFNEGDSYDGLAPVGAMKACEGGYPGLYDLKGNLFEFVDAPYSCCNAFGGSFNGVEVHAPGVPASTTCDALQDVNITTPRHDIGFRCCADALSGTP